MLLPGVSAVMVLGLLTECVRGWWFMDNYKGRPPDGTLRCYQCDTNSTRPEEAQSSKLCSLVNWKHANVSEKRAMIMQCPRRKSAFCHLVVREEEPEYAVRGCHGSHYSHGGQGGEAHTGCFYMLQPPPLRRACLCDSILCNGHPSTHLPHSSLLLPTVLFTMLNYP